MNSSRLFPLLAAVFSGIALWRPDLFSGGGDLIVPLLALVMFAMGLSLNAADFSRVLQMPLPVLLGLGLQFTVMPFAAFAISRILGLSPELTAGMVVVGSCAGGTASNVMCYLARADVALSITMTGCSTLLGVFVTPLLCSLYLSTTVDVDTAGMFLNIVQVVLLPVVLGVGLNQMLAERVEKLQPFLPTFAMISILLIIAIVVSLNADRLVQIGLLTILAVALHNLIGLAGGYQIARLCGISIDQSRTIAIEVGMQNSGLGVALALEFFSATAALPGAIFSIWHNISGSLLASFWRSSSDSTENRTV